jgi:hypothetical protein
LKAAHAVQKRLDVFMWDFDLRELNGDDLRRDPLNVDARQLNPFKLVEADD